MSKMFKSISFRIPGRTTAGAGGSKDANEINNDEISLKVKLILSETSTIIKSDDNLSIFTDCWTKVSIILAVDRMHQVPFLCISDKDTHKKVMMDMTTSVQDTLTDSKSKTCFAICTLDSVIHINCPTANLKSLWIQTIKLMLTTYPRASLNPIHIYTSEYKNFDTFRRAPEMKGYLNLKAVKSREKDSDDRVTFWKRLWFRSSRTCLVLTESEELGSKLIGEISFKIGAIDLISEEIGGRPNCLKLICGFSSMIMQAADETEMLEWASVLYCCLLVANNGDWWQARERRLSLMGSRNEEGAFSKPAAECCTPTRRRSSEELRGIYERQFPKTFTTADQLSGSSQSDKAYFTTDDVGKVVSSSAEDQQQGIATTTVQDAQVAGQESATYATSAVDDVIADEEYVQRNAVEPEPSAEVDEAVGLSEDPFVFSFEEPELAPDNSVDIGDIQLTGEDEDVKSDDRFQDDELAGASQYSLPTSGLNPEEVEAVTDSLKNIFKKYAKEIESDGGYINVMQFSSIWRAATGEKGNLFKEMKYFNSMDIDGKGFINESEFVTGWIKLAEGGQAGGDHLVRRLSDHSQSAHITNKK